MPSSSSSKTKGKSTAATTIPAVPPLDPPTFSSLPTDLDTANPSRYELWSVRIPADVDPAELLDGRTIQLKKGLLGGLGGGVTAAGLGSIVSSAFAADKDGGEEHAFMLGHDAESATYRVLVRGGSGGGKKNNKSSSIEDDDNGSDSDSSSSSSSSSSTSSSSSSSSSDKDSEKEDQPQQLPSGDDMPPSARMMAARHQSPEYQLRPLPRSFQRHVSLVVLPPGGDEAYHDRALAPSAERAPEWTTGEQRVKVAYVPVRQVGGLKRRWMPVGAVGGADRLGVDGPRIGEVAVMKCVGVFGNANGGESSEDTPAKKKARAEESTTAKSSSKKDGKKKSKDKNKDSGKKKRKSSKA